jgi:hypothetical protein
MTNDDAKALVVKFEGKEYKWWQGAWTTISNLTINTSLSQKISVYCIKEGIVDKSFFNKKENT